MSAELSQALRPVSSDSHPWVIASPATERHVLVRDSARFTGKPEVTTHILSFLLASDFPEAGPETILLVVGSWVEFVIVSIRARSGSTLMAALMAALLLTPIKLLNQSRLYLR